VREVDRTSAITQSRSKRSSVGFRRSVDFRFCHREQLQHFSESGSLRRREATMAYIDNYCGLNPLHTLGMAAAALVQEGGGVRAAHEWKH